MKPSSNPPQSGSQHPEVSQEARREGIRSFVLQLSDSDRAILLDYLNYEESNFLAMLKEMRERHGNRFDELAYAIHQITEEYNMPTDDVHALIKEELDQLAVMTLEDVDSGQIAAMSVRVAVTDVTNQGVDPFGLTHISRNPQASSPLPPPSPRPAESAPSVKHSAEEWLIKYLQSEASRQERGIIYEDVTVVQQKQTMRPVTAALLRRLSEPGMGISFNEAKQLTERVITEMSLTMQMPPPALVKETTQVPAAGSFEKEPNPATAPVGRPNELPKHLVTGLVRKGEMPELASSPWLGELDKILFKRLEAWINKIPENQFPMLLDIVELDANDSQKIAELTVKYGSAFGTLAQLHEQLAGISKETRSPLKHLKSLVPVILDGGQMLESAPLEPGKKQKDMVTVISSRKK